MRRLKPRKGLIMMALWIHRGPVVRIREVPQHTPVNRIQSWVTLIIIISGDKIDEPAILPSISNMKKKYSEAQVHWLWGTGKYSNSANIDDIMKGNDILPSLSNDIMLETSDICSECLNDTMSQGNEAIVSYEPDISKYFGSDLRLTFITAINRNCQPWHQMKPAHSFQTPSGDSQFCHKWDNSWTHRLRQPQKNYVCTLANHPFTWSEPKIPDK